MSKWPTDFVFLFLLVIQWFIWNSLFQFVVKRIWCCCLIYHHVWVIMEEDGCLSKADDAHRMSENIKLLIAQ